MTDHRSPPPETEACLCRRYPSTQKGGTLIAEDVTELGEHTRKLAGGGYRPSCCGRCGATVHIHDFRLRMLKDDLALSTEIARFRCADRKTCGAVWQVIPAFMARHLWRSWRTVERAVGACAPAVVSERTRRRWRARLRTSAALLVTVLATAVQVSRLARLVEATCAETHRGELVIAFVGLTKPPPGEHFSRLSALVHRLAPGVRLM